MRFRFSELFIFPIRQRTCALYIFYEQTKRGNHPMNAENQGQNQNQTAPFGRIVHEINPVTFVVDAKRRQGCFGRPASFRLYQRRGHHGPGYGRLSRETRVSRLCGFGRDYRRRGEACRRVSAVRAERRGENRHRERDTLRGDSLGRNR